MPVLRVRAEEGRRAMVSMTFRPLGTLRALLKARRPAGGWGWRGGVTCPAETRADGVEKLKLNDSGLIPFARVETTMWVWEHRSGLSCGSVTSPMARVWSDSHVFSTTEQSSVRCQTHMLFLVLWDCLALRNLRGQNPSEKYVKNYYCSVYSWNQLPGLFRILGHFIAPKSKSFDFEYLLLPSLDLWYTVYGLDPILWQCWQLTAS